MKRELVRGLGVAIGAVAVYATVVEPHWIEVRRVRIHMRGLPRSLEGLRLALLTDLHAATELSLRRVRRAAALAMRASPAVVALTGDFAAKRLPSFGPVFDALAELTPPLGVYAVPGNHDHRLGIAEWQRQLREYSNISDLTNRSIVIPIGEARLCIAGVDDLAEGTPSLASLPHPSERDVTILLAHNPEQAERARRAFDSIDLVLSGHTHGGQIRLPLIGPIRSSVEHGDLYEDGLRRRPWTQVYTSRGIGTARIPARFMSRPEVAILELSGAARPAHRERG